MANKLLRWLRNRFSDLDDLLMASYELELIDSDDDFVRVRSQGEELVADRRLGLVRRGATTLARFDQIRSIDIRHHRGGNDEPEHWSINLHLSWYSQVFIGKTTDAAEASIIAAYLGTLTGLRVLNL
jgi:hypothetical protein